ncbi:MAG: N-glycosylase/DNA lyase [Candidatus Woesearchaeota archaeon]|nr:MAG: N-glycosylase/DNA lyase [Candidatus Woesearchaeota archaeon]
MNIHQEYQKKKPIIEKRLKEFKAVKNDGIFYELCFCILTPQSKGLNADKIVQILKKLDFKNNNFDPTTHLKSLTRFHNHKSQYLQEAKQKYPLVLEKLSSIKDSEELRKWLVENINGFGLKESSHFLRNIGYENLAILDRHILKNLVKNQAIPELPKTLTPKKYFEIEQKFKEFSQKVNIPIDHLDLLFWSLETGEVFK